MKHFILTWDVIGIIFIIILGSILHFAFAWSGYWQPLALFAAVNESVWEHLKLAFWPGLLWAIIEYYRSSKAFSNFWSVKGFSLLIAPTLIVIIFYGYTSLLGANILILDICTFIFAIIIGQLVSSWLLLHSSRTIFVQYAGLSVLAAQIVAYATFTYDPPDFEIFIDKRDNIRGIQIYSIRTNLFIG